MRHFSSNAPHFLPTLCSAVTFPTLLDLQARDYVMYKKKETAPEGLYL